MFNLSEEKVRKIKSCCNNEIIMNNEEKSDWGCKTCRGSCKLSSASLCFKKL